MRIVVIGAGVIGANMAYRLSAERHMVTVLDAGRPGQGTTGTTISWISNFPQAAEPDPAMLGIRLNIKKSYADLEAEIGGDWMHWTDTLTWAAAPAIRDRLRADWKTSAERGVPVELVSGREAVALDPVLTIPGDAEVYVEHGCGWVDAPLFTKTLLAAASGRGAVVRERTRVAAIGTDGGRVTGVITEAGEQIPADTVVNAAGSWASHIGALAGCPVPLDLRPGLIVYSQPLSGAPLRSVLNTPLMNIRPHHDGSVAIHARAESMYEPHHWNALDPADVIRAAARWLPGLDGTTPRSSRVGIRPVPPGGPVIGPHPCLDGLYIAVSHGGVALAPQWASFAASEIEETPVPQLDQWRPARFLVGPASLAEGDI